MVGCSQQLKDIAADKPQATVDDLIDTIMKDHRKYIKW